MRDEPGPTIIDAEHLSGGVAADTPYQIPAHYLLDLVGLKPLPIPMDSWAVDLDVLRHGGNWRFLREYTRITSRLGVSIKDSDADLMLANDIVLSAGPSVGLTLNASPYHWGRGCNDDPLPWENIAYHIEMIEKHLARCKALSLRVSSIIFDMECFKKASATVTDRLDRMYHLAKVYYPEVPYFLYRDGDWAPNLDALSDGVPTIIQYRPYSYRHTEAWLDKWTKLKPEVTSWGVWITLGPGYKDGWQWKLNLDSWVYDRLGRSHAADKRIKALICYPNVFRQKTMPGSVEAFIAYAKGMTGR